MHVTREAKPYHPATRDFGNAFTAPSRQKQARETTGVPASRVNLKFRAWWDALDESS